MNGLSARAAAIYDRQPAGISAICALMVLVIDYGTGKQIEFPILFGLPIALAAWKLRKGIAYAMAVGLPLIRLAFLAHWGELQPIVIALSNVSIIVVSLLLYAYLIQRTAWQTLKLKRKVKSLEGFLSICASCKKIRNEQGDYEQLEKYVTDHSEALFSHGLCPECARKLYPEIQLPP